MKRIFVAAFALVGAACTPQPDTSEAEGVIRDLYATVEEHIGRVSTPLDAIPMTDELASLTSRAQVAALARNEPFIEGDIAANCQDCTSISGLEVGPQTGPEPVPAAEGHVMLEARFTLNGNEPRAVLYDMVETPQGWRIDNILTDGFNLRTEAQSYLDDSAGPAEEAPAP